MVSTLGVMTKTSYFTNGLFDPQVAVGGHQPMGWDQALQYYNLAIVMGSTIKAEFDWASSAAAALAPVAIGMELHNSSVTTYSDFTAYAEAGYDVQTLPVNAIKTVTVKEAFNHFQYFRSDPRGNLSDNANFASGNAVRTATYTAFIQSWDRATTSGVVQVKFTIDYDVEFSDPQFIAQS